MSEPRIVWIVQLPPEWKAIFETIAEENGDTAYGNGAREVKRSLNRRIQERLKNENRNSRHKL